ncbi:MAG: hypothetical protein ACLQDV_23710 [Candidatus Binataceae bacterium]
MAAPISEIIEANPLNDRPDVSRRGLFSSERPVGRAHQTCKESWATWALLLLIALAYAIPVALKRDHFWPDDASFYPQVALNIVRTGSSSFNGGITSTNGYHPLWMCINVVAALLSRGNKIGIVWILSFVEALLIGLTAISYRRLAKSVGLEGILGLCLLLAVLGSGLQLWGMEAHLSALLIVLTALQLEICARRQNVTNRLLLGVLVGLTILARLDNAFFAAAVLVFGSSGSSLKITVRRALTIGFVTSALVLPYIGLNFVLYGHLLPISGAIKSSFPHLTGRLSSLGTLGFYTMFVALSGIALSVWCPVDPSGWRRVVAALSWGTLGQAVYLWLFGYYLTGNPWEQVLGLVNTIVLVDVVYASALRSRHERRRPRLVAWASGISVLFVAGTIAMNWYTISDVHVRQGEQGNSWCTVELAGWMNSHLPPGSRILAFDSPGRLAFDSDMSIVPVDGLINDYAFADMLASRGIGFFVKTKQMQYCLAPIVKPGMSQAWTFETTVGERNFERMDVVAPLTHMSGGSLLLPREDLVLRTRDLSPDCRDLGLWRLQP